MFNRITSFFTHIVNKYLPDPLVFAIILTLIVLVLSMLLQHSVVKVIEVWGDGFFNLLAFSMQMCIVVVTGYALASSPPVKNLLRNVAKKIKTPESAAYWVVFFGLIASMINWGFGLVVGALFAKEIARYLKNVDYPILIACAYIGFLSWGGGLSGSMPLLAATPNNPVEQSIGGIIPLKDTIFTAYNAFVCIGLLIVMPIVCKKMTPKTPTPINPELLREEPNFNINLDSNATFAQKLEESRILALTIVALGITWLILYVQKNGFNFTINTVNFIFIISGLLLHKTPMAYMRAIAHASRTTAGILIQFPFYASIALLMEKCGLGELITNFFIDISNAQSFALMTFFSSAFINFAVPSGGGHWVIQGPFVIEAAKSVGADLGKATMAIAYGEQWANMIQPFWALPALAIAGLGARAIMGYCMMALFISAPIFILGLILF